MEIHTRRLVHFNVLPLHSEGLPRRSDIHPRWAASRIPSRETRRMTANCSRKLLNPFFAEVNHCLINRAPVTYPNPRVRDFMSTTIRDSVLGHITDPDPHVQP